MTEEIGSDAHKRPSQPEIKMAVLEERLKEARSTDREILATLKDIQRELERQGTMLALGNQRFDAIESSQEDTTARLTMIESDKRGVAGIIAGTISGIGTIAVAFWVAMKGG